LEAIWKLAFNSYFRVLGTSYFSSASHGAERFQTALQTVTSVARGIDVGVLDKELDVGSLLHYAAVVRS
jgi:hypothetical protein